MNLLVDDTNDLIVIVISADCFLCFVFFSVLLFFNYKAFPPNRSAAVTRRHRFLKFRFFEMPPVCMEANQAMISSTNIIFLGDCLT